MSNKLQNIVAARLSMQSTQKKLALYKLPSIDLNYLQSKEFVEKHFSTWDTLRQRHFLKDVAGTYMKEFESELIKNK